MSTTPIIALSAPIAIEAGDAKRVPSFEALIYSGGSLEIGNWDMPVVVDLAGLENGKVLVANLDHDSTKRVGNFEVLNDGRTLKARGVASAATEAQREVIESAKRGYTWQASVEVIPTKVEPVKAGDSVSVNGRMFTGPLYLTRKGTLKGFAFVSHGADDETTVAIAAKVNRGKTMTTDSGFSEWVSQVHGNVELLTAEQLAGLHADYHGRTSITAADRAAALPMIRASNDPIEAEQKRLEQIEAACSGSWGDDLSEQVEALQVAAISGDLTVDELVSRMRQVRSEKFMQSVPKGYSVGASRRDMGGKVIEASFALAGGLSNVEKFYDERILDAADKLRSTASLQQILLAEAARNGYPLRAGERISQGNLRNVLRAAFPAVHATGFSTIDVSSITSNVANKFLLDGWNAVDQTCLRIAAVKAAKDFKQMTTVSLTGGTSFEKVGAGGEIKHGTLGEQTYTNQIATYGEILSITRQDIINDDLNALTAVPRKIGRAAMLKLNSLFWTVLLGAESTGFFASGNANLNTGIADVTIEGLQATERLFINQTDPDGQPLGIMPAIMLVPPSVKGQALGLMNSQSLVGGSSLVPSANVWQGRFRVESSPYMEISSFTGYSAAAWYLIADPNQLPAVEIAALNGRVEPTVGTADADFNVLGIQMRGYSDVGVALAEYRAAVKADGGSS